MSPLSVRPPAVAGKFYPAEAAVLRDTVRGLVDGARVPLFAGMVRAALAPHAGYVYSGPTAGYAFKALAARPAPRRVFLLGPAHFAPVAGVALGAYSAFATPLGDVPVDSATVDALCAAAPHLYQPATHAHVEEHCLEVELPFLAHVWPGVPIVPMLFGAADPQAVAADLAVRLGADDFILVSSDLSHYHDYATARTRDQALLAALVAGDRVRVAQGEACGLAPLLTLMQIAAARSWLAVLADARNSGDTAGPREQVVGYASVVYHDHPLD